MFWNISDRVYLNVGEDFFQDGNCDLLDLLDLVARHAKVYQGEFLYGRNECDQIVTYYRRTKRCIVKEANRFIDGLNETVADESALSHVSITQINRLIRALQKRHGRVTCYAMILIHVCSLLISDNYDDNIPIDQDMISKYLRMIQAVSESYYREYADPLAHFLLGCAPVVTAEINSGWGQESLKGPESFPPIPKRSLKKTDE